MRRCKLPSGVSTGLSVVESGVSETFKIVTALGSPVTGSLDVAAPVKSGVAASSVVPALVTTSDPPGAGVADRIGSHFVGLALRDDVTSDSVAVFTKRAHKTINI